MTFAEQYLVVLLSIFLAIFLVLGIFALAKVNQILSSVKTITDKAEQLADQAEEVGSAMKKAAGPIAAGKVVTSIINAIKQHKESKEKQHEK